MCGMRGKDDFDIPKNEIELLDKVKYYYYNRDMVGLIYFMRFLYKNLFEDKKDSI